ncbi:heterokaryon incompatibility protein-domain-containing protein, partial [Lasiosphaeris hirsuta]
MLQDIIQGLIGTGDEEPAPLSESYTYTQRLQPRCIRLLKLAPGPASSPIECTVQIHSIDNPPDFEALSYVWGSSADPVIIVCDSKRLTVTQNLHAALLQLRQFDTFRDGRLLWIDAICINQGDETEKTAQVRLMREIYSRAHNTTIWLGPNDD